MPRVTPRSCTRSSNRSHPPRAQRMKICAACHLGRRSSRWRAISPRFDVANRSHGSCAEAPEEASWPWVGIPRSAAPTQPIASDSITSPRPKNKKTSAAVTRSGDNRLWCGRITENRISKVAHLTAAHPSKPRRPNTARHSPKPQVGSNRGSQRHYPLAALRRFPSGQLSGTKGLFRIAGQSAPACRRCIARRVVARPLCKPPSSGCKAVIAPKLLSCR